MPTTPDPRHSVQRLILSPDLKTVGTSRHSPVFRVWPTERLTRSRMTDTAALCTGDIFNSASDGLRGCAFDVGGCAAKPLSRQENWLHGEKTAVSHFLARSRPDAPGMSA